MSGGGTGQTTFPSGNILYGNGTSPLQSASHTQISSNSLWQQDATSSHILRGFNGWMTTRVQGIRQRLDGRVHRFGNENKSNDNSQYRPPDLW